MITEQEYNILKNINPIYWDGYIVRNAATSILCVFYDYPHKDMEFKCWDSELGEIHNLELFSHLFSTIKWNDDNPKKIIDYIIEYEKKE